MQYSYDAAILGGPEKFLRILRKSLKKYFHFRKFSKSINFFSFWVPSRFRRICDVFVCHHIGSFFDFDEDITCLCASTLGHFPILCGTDFDENVICLCAATLGGVSISTKM